MIVNNLEQLYGQNRGLARRADTLRNIEDVNLLYLKGLRDLALHDPAQASALYGVTEQAATEIAEASIEDIRTLAEGCIAVFRLQCNKNSNVFADCDPKSRMAQLARVIK